MGFAYFFKMNQSSMIVTVMKKLKKMQTLKPKAKKEMLLVSFYLTFFTNTLIHNCARWHVSFKDLIADLLDDDETSPKPKPSTVAPQALDVTPDDGELADDEEEEELDAVEPQITIQKVPEVKPTPKPTKAPRKPKTTTTIAPKNSDLPPLNLQNTPALLELQAQLTANNNVKGGDLSEEDTVTTPKPTKAQKKKKTPPKGQLKKQTAITTNEISETPAKKTLLGDEATKPQVIVEESVVMEKVPLKTPEGEKLKQKQQQQQVVDEYDDDESEQAVESVKS